MQENSYYITNHVNDIKEKAVFLENKGFKIVSISEYIIKYSHKDICSIEVYYGRYSDVADVCVRYENNGLSRPEEYSLGWLRNMKKFKTGESDIFRKAGEKIDKIADILSLLKYLEANFDEVTNIEFCRKTWNEINENFNKGIWK